MEIKEAIEEIKKCRGNAEAKRIAITCMQYIVNLQRHCEHDLFTGENRTFTEHK